MSILFDPKDRGFPDSLSVVDRCQIALLRDLAHSTDGRLVLKGGLAMRVVVGSMRLTKDVDFDRAAGVSTSSVQGSVKKALQYAAQSAGLRDAQIEPGKQTETTVRMRLTGVVAGAPVRFVIEVSGRNPVPRQYQTRVQVTPPARYGIAPFTIATYTPEMLAASKVMAVMSANRNVPRDVFDLNDLQGVDPQPILAMRVGAGDLAAIGCDALDKICAIDFAHAQQELLPYIPPDIRQQLDPQRWDEMSLNVAQTVQKWVTGAALQAATMAGRPS